MNIDSIINGIVIDHITAGKAMQIYNMLKLDKLDCQVAIIKNATSNKKGTKDIIKIASDIDIDLGVLAFICPSATINIIRDGKVIEKRDLKLPERIEGVLRCKNPRCITTTEQEIRHIFILTNPETAGSYMMYASKLAYYDLDYDVFGTSYYPYWHGTLDNLKQVLSEVAQTYGKKVMVMETSYAYTLEDGDFSGNTIGEGGGYEKYWPVTVQGQSGELQDVVSAVHAVGGIGVCWWEGAWVPVGTSSFEENSRLWEAYGSGWASSYAGTYDPKDAGVYYGGCACENQAMFDFEGKALPSLATFGLLRTGHIVELAPDAIDDAVLTCDLAGEVVLPETVAAVMNDGSRVQIPVTWEAVDTEALKAAGPAEYTVRGDAQGMQATLLLRMVNFNYLINGDFEGEDGGEWITDNFGETEQLYIEEKKSDSLDGKKHYHFYSAASDHVGFRLEQIVEDLPAGTYLFDVSIMGGDAGEYESYSYILVNGVEAARAGLEITSWNAWHKGACEASVQDGDRVTVGVYVVCKGAGAWGKIDAATLTRIQ